MNTKKVLKKTAGAVVLSFGVAFKLAELGLSVSEIVLSGEKSLEKQFTNSSDKPIGNFLFNKTREGSKKLSQTFFKYAKELFH